MILQSMRANLVLGILVGVFCSGAMAQEPAAPATGQKSAHLETLFTQADELFAAQKYPDAANVYSEILSFCATSFDSSDYGLDQVFVLRAGLFQAQAYDSARIDSTALKSYAQLSANFPSPTIVNMAYFRRGMISYRQGLWAQAISCFEAQRQVTGVGKNKELGLYYLGLSYQGKGMIDKARETFEGYLKLHPYTPYSNQIRRALEKL